MTDTYKATPEQWAEAGAFASATRACILELRARIEQLEAQANHSPGATKMAPVATDEELKAMWNVPGTNLEVFRAVYDLGVAHGSREATDEELDDTWHKTTGGTFLARRRAVYDLGVAHGQAGSREVAEPAPVAGGLVERVRLAIFSVSLDEEARAAILEVAKWLREQGTPASGWAMRLEQEAGR